MSSKSVTILLEKSEKLKHDLKKRYDPSRKKVRNWKMSSKSVTVLLEKFGKLKNVLKKRFDPSREKLKIEKCPHKRFGSSRKK